MNIEITFQNKFHALVITLFLYEYHYTTAATLKRKKKRRNWPFQFQENLFQVDWHRAISGRELWIAQDSVAQQEGGEGVEYGLSKTWHLVPCWKKW